MDRFIYFEAKPDRVGSEGCGVITAIGSGVDPKLLNKKVAFMYNAWSEYVILDHEEVVLLDDTQDLSKAASACINPFTVLGLLEIATKRGDKAIIQTAAASMLGKQVISTMRAHGIKTINIVRRDEQVI